ncbi:MAG: hypothetical protein WD046_01410 [Paracoccaceae bacterium]
MSKNKLKAPVGLSPRQSPGDAVRNNPDDVEFLRKMLVANGMKSLPVHTKMDSGLLKAIADYQKKIGIKKPDQVVDPGGRTEKAGLPKLLAAEKEADKLKMVKVKYRGKELLVTEEDHKKLVQDVFKQLDNYIKSLIKSHEINVKTYESYLDTAQLKDGILNAVAQAIIMKAGGVKLPKVSYVTDSIKATGALQRAQMQRNIEALDTALPEAEKAINKLSSEMLKFLKDFTGSAQTTGTVLMVSSAVCFAVVGALATPVIVTGTGMSLAAATVTSGASVGVLSSASQELGKHASGQKVTLWDSVQAVVVDGTIGGLTAGIGSKIPLGFVDDMAKGLAPKIAAKVPFMTSAQATKFISNYLAGSGQEVIKTAVSEGVKVVGKIAKTGKAPTEKDFKEAVQAVLFSALAGGLLKNLGGFQKKWAYKYKDTLQGKILPDALAKLTKNNEIPKVIKAKMYAEVMNKVSEEVMKVGFNEVLNEATGSENEAKMIDMAEKALLKDRKIQSLVEAELKKSAKKHKIPGF